MEPGYHGMLDFYRTELPLQMGLERWECTVTRRCRIRSFGDC